MGGEALKVQHGQIMMLPSGDPRWITDQPGRNLTRACVPARRVSWVNPYSKNSKITNRLICGLVHFDQEVSPRLRIR